MVSKRLSTTTTTAIAIADIVPHDRCRLLQQCLDVVGNVGHHGSYQQRHHGPAVHSAADVRQSATDLQLVVPVQYALVQRGELPSGLERNVAVRRSIPGGTANQGRASFPTRRSSDLATHHHPFKGTLSTRSCEVGLIDGCCADGYGANGNYLYQNLSGDSQAQIPYMSVPLCVQVSGGGGSATAATTATATATAPRKPAVGEGSARIIRRKKH